MMMNKMSRQQDDRITSKDQRTEHREHRHKPRCSHLQLQYNKTNKTPINSTDEEQQNHMRTWLWHHLKHTPHSSWKESGMLTCSMTSNMVNARFLADLRKLKLGILIDAELRGTVEQFTQSSRQDLITYNRCWSFSCTAAPVSSTHATPM